MKTGKTVTGLKNRKLFNENYKDFWIVTNYLMILNFAKYFKWF